MRSAVLVVRDGRSEPCFDLRSHDCALSFGIEYPTLGLGRAKTNDPTCDILANLSLRVPSGGIASALSSAAIASRRAATAMRSRCRYGRTEVPP